MLSEINVSLKRRERLTIGEKQNDEDDNYWKSTS